MCHRGGKSREASLLRSLVGEGRGRLQNPDDDYDDDDDDDDDCDDDDCDDADGYDDYMMVMMIMMMVMMIVMMIMMMMMINYPKCETSSARFIEEGEQIMRV